MAAVEPAVMQRFFSNPGISAAAAIRKTLLATNPVGYAGCCAAIRDMDQRPLLGAVGVPTLVIAGLGDVSTPWEGHGSVLAASIPGARTALLEAAHLSNLERPGEFTAVLLEFLLAP